VIRSRQVTVLNRYKLFKSEIPNEHAFLD